jgi:hypothetical protein
LLVREQGAIGGLNKSRSAATASSEDARIAIRALTAEQREDLFRFARSELPDGHRLKCQIDALVEKTSQRLGHIVDEALDAEINETAIEVWKEIEGLKDAAERDRARIIEEYRRTRLARVEQFLGLGSIAEQELDELKKAFAEAHEHHPDLCAWLYINELATPTGPGTLYFLELANRAARSFVRAGSDCAWKYWLEIVVGYLLKNDLAQEHIQKYPVGHVDHPPGRSPETHQVVIIQGENYEIRQVFKASEHCCSWLKRRWWSEKLSSTGSPDTADGTPGSHTGTRQSAGTTTGDASAEGRGDARPEPGESGNIGGTEFPAVRLPKGKGILSDGQRSDTRRAVRKPDPRLENLRSEVRKMRAARLTQREMCGRLSGKPRPPV